MVSSDGTFGLPIDYVKRVRVYSSTNPPEDPKPTVDYDEYYMFVTAISGFKPDRSSNEFFEFTVTLHELKSGVAVETAN